MSKLKRKVHIKNEEWTWQYNSGNIRIKSPEGFNYRITQSELMGVSWDELERAYHKGYANVYSVTPSVIKKYIENNLCINTKKS